MRIVTRAEWGARPPLDPAKVVTVPITRRTEFFGHYLGGAPFTGDPIPFIRYIQRLHQGADGHETWNDIGYNHLIDQAGTVYEGRGRDIAGAHCPDHNTSGIGVCLLIGGSQVPTAAAMRSFWELHADCSAAAGHRLTPLGHRDGYSTDCPGDPFYRLIHAGPQQEQEDDMPLTDDDVKRVGDHLVKRLGADATHPYTGAFIVRGLAALEARVSEGQQQIIKAVQAIQAGDGATAQAIIDELASRPITVEIGSDS